MMIGIPAPKLAGDTPTLDSARNPWEFCLVAGTKTNRVHLCFKNVKSGEITMPTPNEYRQQASECLELMKEANEWYVRTALLELAVEFQKRAQKLEHIDTFRPSARCAALR